MSESPLSEYPGYPFWKYPRISWDLKTAHLQQANFNEVLAIKLNGELQIELARSLKRSAKKVTYFQHETDGALFVPG